MGFEGEEKDWVVLEENRLEGCLFLFPQAILLPFHPEVSSVDASLPLPMSHGRRYLCVSPNGYMLYTHSVACAFD